MTIKWIMANKVNISNNSRRTVDKIVKSKAKTTIKATVRVESKHYSSPNSPCPPEAINSERQNEMLHESPNLPVAKVSKKPTQEDQTRIVA